MSKRLSRLTTAAGESYSQNKERCTESVTNSVESENSATSNKHNKSGQQAFALFHGGQINQSPTIQAIGKRDGENEGKRKYKRIKVRSDSEDSLDLIFFLRWLRYVHV